MQLSFQDHQPSPDTLLIKNIAHVSIPEKNDDEKKPNSNTGVFSFFHYLSGKEPSIATSCKNIWLCISKANIMKLMDKEVYTCFFSNAGATLSSLIQKIYSIVRTILVVVNWVVQAGLHIKQGISCIPVVNAVAMLFVPFTFVEIASRITKAQSLAKMIFTYSPKTTFKTEQEQLEYTAKLVNKFSQKVVVHMHSKETDASDHEKENYPWQLAQKIQNDIPLLANKLNQALQNENSLSLEEKAALCHEALSLIEEFTVQNRKLFISEIWNVFQAAFTVLTLVFTCFNPPLGLTFLIITSTLSVILPLVSHAISEGLLTQKGWNFSVKECFYLESVRNAFKAVAKLYKKIKGPASSEKKEKLVEKQKQSAATPTQLDPANLRIENAEKYMCG